MNQLLLFCTRSPLRKFKIQVRQGSNLGCCCGDDLGGVCSSGKVYRKMGGGGSVCITSRIAESYQPSKVDLGSQVKR